MAVAMDRAGAGTLGLAVCVLPGSLAVSSANAVLPGIAAGLGVSFGSAQWVVLSYLLAATALVVVVGRLADGLGRRRVLLAGVGLFTLGSVLGAAAPGLAVLVVGRAVQGVGGAAMVALAVAQAGDRRVGAGRAIGVLGSVSAVGTALGPAVGGGLMALGGWRLVFAVGVPLGAAAWAAAARAVPPGEPSGRTRLDVPGMVLLALTLTAFALALTLGRAWGVAWLLLAAAVGGAGVFAWWQTRTLDPLVRPADAARAGRALAQSALVSAVMMGSLVVGPYYLARGLGLTPGAVGAMLSAGPVAAAVVGGPAGRAVDRLGAGRAAVVGLVVMLAGSLGAAGAAAGLVGVVGVWAYAAAMVGLASGYAVFQAANTSAAMAAAPAGRRGVMSGLLTVSRHLGLVCGAAGLGAVFAAFGGSAGPGGSAAVGMAGRVGVGACAAFVAASGLVVVAMGVAGWRRAS